MIIPSNLKCDNCPKIFCCIQCRIKHEIKMHKELSNKNLDCPICCGKPLPFGKQHNDQQYKSIVLEHVCNEHLPLHCSKCRTIFTEKTDFLNVLACCNDSNIITKELPITNENKENEKPPSTCLLLDTPSSNTIKETAKEFTPIFSENNKELNVHKSSETSISDSVSSIRNVSVIDNSSINILYKTASPVKKQCRPTSTPMNRIICATVKQASFDSTESSSCQMSTINHTNNDTNDVSPPIIRTINTTTSVTKSMRPRNKLPPAATPLRQVMSKSIQKAIVQHGMPMINFQRPISGGSYTSELKMSPPLDLRTSPVIRRSKYSDTENSPTDTVITSNDCHLTQNVMQQQTKQHLENVFHQSSSVNIQISLHQSASITSSGGGCSGVNESKSISKCNSNYQLDTVYETCRVIEEQTEILQTPKITGALKRNPSERNILCDLIEPSPDNFSKSNKNENNDDDDDDDDEDANEDVWYTPTIEPKPIKQTTIRTKSLGDLQPYIYQSIQQQNRKLSLQEMEVKQINPLIKEQQIQCKYGEKLEQIECKEGGKLWSLVSSVMRFVKSGTITKPIEKIESPRKISPLVRRWASFAGASIHQTVNDIEPPYKRRRTSTVDIPVSSNNFIDNKRTKRINGRMPIERMRKLQ